MPEADSDLLPLLSPKKAVERRNTPGGTSPEQVRKQVADAGARLAKYREKANKYRNNLPDGY